VAHTQYAEAEEPKRGPWLSIVVVIGLAIIGVASAFLWRAYSDSVSPYSSFASAKGPATVDAADKPVTLKDFQAFQQQIAGPLQSTTQLLAAQQAEIKRLADQVSVLSAKVDLLQRPLASAQAAMPAPQPVAPAPRRKPAPPKPAGPISTGGAPIQLTR
jgi:hypothetical protein